MHRRQILAAAFTWFGIFNGASVSAQDVVVPTEATAIRRLSDRLNDLQARLDQQSLPTSARAHIDFVEPLPSGDPDARLFVIAGWGFTCSASDSDLGRPQIVVDGVELNVNVTRVDRGDVAAAYPPWYCASYGGGTIPKYAGIMAVIDLRSVQPLLDGTPDHKIWIRVYDPAARVFDSATHGLPLPQPSPASKAVRVKR